MYTGEFSSGEWEYTGEMCTREFTSGEFTVFYAELELKNKYQNIPKLLDKQISMFKVCINVFPCFPASRCA